MTDAPVSSQLAAQLDRLATLLADRAPTAADGSPAQLAALMPAEPVVGEVAVACWVAEDGGEQFDLVRLDDGAPIHDRTAMRETLALIAMTETLEELASFDALDELRAGMIAWIQRVDPAQPLAREFANADAVLGRLAAIAPPDEGRIARTQILDTIGMVLRELEDRWQHLEQAAELWSDAHLEAAGDAREAALADVQELWRVLGMARRGPLATPAATAVHAGREAGVALAAAIADAGS